jgi:hypothetical protein
MMVLVVVAMEYNIPLPGAIAQEGIVTEHIVVVVLRWYSSSCWKTTV